MYVQLQKNDVYIIISRNENNNDLMVKGKAKRQ